MLDRLLSAVVAISLAFLGWLYVRSRHEETLDAVPVPVQVTLASREADFYSLEVGGGGQVPVSFHGPTSRVREVRNLIQRGEMNVQLTYSVPSDRAGESKFLDTIRVTATDLRTPSGVRVVVMEGQNRIPVTVRKLVERSLPVRLDHGLGDRISSVQVEPSMVLVRGPQDVLDRLQSVPTRPYTLPAQVSTTSLREVTSPRGSVDLLEEVDGVPVRVTPRAVSVKVTLRPKRKLYELTVPVHFLCPTEFAFKPVWQRIGSRAGHVRLQVLGPATEEPPAVHAFIDLTGREFNAARDPSQQLFADEPIRVQLPRDFQLAQSAPRSETFKLVPVTPPMVNP